MEKVFIEELVNLLTPHRLSGAVPNIADVLATTDWSNPGAGAYKVWISLDEANRIVEEYKVQQQTKQVERQEHDRKYQTVLEQNKVNLAKYEEEQERAEEDLRQQLIDIENKRAQRIAKEEEELKQWLEANEKAKRDYEEQERELAKQRQAAVDEINALQAENQRQQAESKARIEQSNRDAQQKSSDFFARHNQEKADRELQRRNTEEALRKELALINLADYVTPSQLGKDLSVEPGTAISIAKKHGFAWQYIKNPDAINAEPGTSFSPELYVITAEEAQAVMNLENAEEEAEEASRLKNQELIEKAAKERAEKKILIEQLKVQNEAVRRFVDNPSSDPNVVGWIKTKMEG